MFFIVIRLSIFLLPILSGKIVFSQNADGPIEITPALIKKLKKEVEDSALLLKNSLIKEEHSAFDIEFSLHTFRIERYMEGFIEYNYSTVGMRQASYEAAQKYDSLLNKYYKKLLAILKPADKLTLIQAQKAWIAFRDNELKLIGTLSKEEYSGGGTIQGIIDSSLYLEIIRERVLSIVSHIQRVTQEY